MSDMATEAPAKSGRSVPMQILRGLFIAFLVFFALFFLLLSSESFIDAIYALIAGWVIHGTRVLPGFFGQWQSALVPLTALIFAWLVAHRLLRWWLATRKHSVENGWTIWRTGALLGLVLLCGAAAVAISGVAHQMMWLGQTQWTQSNRRTDLHEMVSNTRQMMMCMLLFDMDHDRLPYSWEELFQWDESQNAESIMHHMIGRGKGHSMPVLTKPGADLQGMNPATVLMITDQVNGSHVVAKADLTVRSITPEQLDALIARGDWLPIDLHKTEP